MIGDNSMTMKNLAAIRPMSGGNTHLGFGPSSASVSKPLNKITWDSFSQIAKLSGDVDHEPSTPKSGKMNLLGNVEEDEDYDIE